MTRLKITTPVPDYSGNCGAVQFDQGVGYADSEVHAAEVGYMRANGYTVEEADPAVISLRQTREDLGFTAEQVAEMEAEDKGVVLMPRKSGSADAWRAYAVAHGMPADEAESLTRDQLVERFTTTEEDQP